MFPRAARRLRGALRGGLGILVACTGSHEERAAERIAMVRTQIEARGVQDARVLEAMRTVPRHAFVPPELADAAYQDGPLAIGHGQTISQPYVVAVMTEALVPEPDDVVLDVGTGSGYQAAVLSRLVKQVYSIEIVPALAEQARERLAALGYTNVEVIVADGWAGLPAHAPYDGILVAAAPPEVPAALVEQLAEGGRLVIPVGAWEQDLRVIERTPDGTLERTLFGVRFVPLVREPAPSDGPAGTPSGGP